MIFDPRTLSGGTNLYFPLGLIIFWCGLLADLLSTRYGKMYGLIESNSLMKWFVNHTWADVVLRMAATVGVGSIFYKLGANDTKGGIILAALSLPEFYLAFRNYKAARK